MLDKIFNRKYYKALKEINRRIRICEIERDFYLRNLENLLDYQIEYGHNNKNEIDEVLRIIDQIRMLKMNLEDLRDNLTKIL